MIVVPIIEILILAETLLFTKHKKASLNDLGWIRTTPKTLTRVLPALMALYLATVAVTFLMTNVFGPDPTLEVFTETAIPRNLFQLVTYLVIKLKGLLIASFLFGLPHIINYPYNAATATATGRVLGYVWQKTDQNTTATAVLHGTFNSIGVILTYLGNVV